MGQSDTVSRGLKTAALAFLHVGELAGHGQMKNRNRLPEMVNFVFADYIGQGGEYLPTNHKEKGRTLENCKEPNWVEVHFGKVLSEKAAVGRTSLCLS